MKDEKNIENKAILPEENKEAPKPSKVRVQVNHNREVAGIGKAGDTKRVDVETASELQSKGLVTILE